MIVPPDWVEVDGALQREFELPSFPDAIAFVKKSVTDYPVQFGNFRD